MFELYGDAGKVFRGNILAKHPVILGLFSGAGGRFILYRPGKPPLEAPAGADRLSAAEIRRPQHDGAGRRWSGPTSTIPPTSRGAARCSPIAAGCSRRSTASIRRAMPAEWRDNNRTILQEQHRLHGRMPRQGRDLRSARWRSSPRSRGRSSRRTSPGRRRPRSHHWMTVLADWKKHARRRLGQDLCRQQHDLRRAPEQRAVQRAGAVLSARGHQRPAAC